MANRYKINNRVPLHTINNRVPEHLERDFLILKNGDRIWDAQYDSSSNRWRVAGAKAMAGNRDWIVPGEVESYLVIIKADNNPGDWISEWDHQKNGYRNMIQIFQDENGTAITTDAADEREFLEGMAILLYDSIIESSPEVDWHRRLQQLLPQIVELSCKYRGYKSDVSEKRVLTTGRALAGDPVAILQSRGKMFEVRKS